MQGILEMPQLIDFDAADLGAQLERVSQAELDALPFGVILLGRDGTVLFYSATEARQSGYGTAPLGQNFFAVSRCRNKAELRERLMRAMEAENADVEFAWSGDYDEPRRDLRIRLQTASRGGLWMCVQRDAGAAQSAA